MKQSIFSRYYPKIEKNMSRAGFSRLREQLVGKTFGQVLDIGCAHGPNIDYLGPSVKGYVGLDPDFNLLRGATNKAIKTDITSSFIQGSATSLPFEDSSFDTVIATLVFCSITNLDNAVGEVYRVLKAGGQLFYLEHVRSKKKLQLVVQKTVNGAWKRIAGGCQLTKDPETLLIKHGFQIQESNFLYFQPHPLFYLTAPMQLGIASKPE